jgi:hypothetical protein
MKYSTADSDWFSIGAQISDSGGIVSPFAAKCTPDVSAGVELFLMRTIVMRFALCGELYD